MFRCFFQWIADYEKQPLPTECGGVDYAAIYRWLAHLCQGEAPPDLDSASSLRVRRLFSRLAKTVAGDGPELVGETDYLREFRGPHTKYQVRLRYIYTFSSKKCIVKISQKLK